MNVLALDPASKTGFCYGSSPAALTFGVWSLGTGPQRLARLEMEIEARLAKFPCEVIAYEIAALGAKGFKAVHQHAELAGKIKEVADRHGLKCCGFHIGTWKARAVGKGNAKPHQYRELIELHHGLRAPCNDSAAAIGVWIAAQQGEAIPAKKQAKRVKKELAKQQIKFRFRAG